MTTTPIGRRNTGERNQIELHSIELTNETPNSHGRTQQFLRWRKGKAGLEVLSFTFKGHIDPSSKHSHLTIHNVSIEMHGKYKCSVKTDLGAHEAEQDLIVISQTSCKLNDWRVTSLPSECKEMFRFDCKNMFPKPVPSCGLWNGKLDKFIRSVMVDISEEENKQTYRIRYADKFDLGSNDNTNLMIRGASHRANNSVSQSDLLQFAGHLIFKCDISVPETSWRLSLVHKMFDYDDGCHQDPLEAVERMRSNYSNYATAKMRQAGYLSDRQPDEFEMLASNLKYELIGPNSATSSGDAQVQLNCWRKPRLGSLARLSCATRSSQARLVGANLLECGPTGWVPLLEQAGGQFLRQAGGARLGPPPPQAESGLSSNDLAENQLSAGGNSTEVEVIPSAEGVASSGAQFEEDRQAGERATLTKPLEPALTPSQLAALLPTCVSTRRQHPANTITSNRLPLLDELRTLESSYSSQEIDHKHLGSQHRAATQRKSSSSLFNFNSSTGSKVEPNLRLTLLSLFIVLLFTIANANYQPNATNEAKWPAKKHLRKKQFHLAPRASAKIQVQALK